MSLKTFTLYWCQTQFPYHVMFVSSDSNITGVTSEAGTANPSRVHVPPVLVEFVLLDLSASVLNFSPFSFGHWISALLRYTVSDYPFSLWYIQTFRKHQNTHV